MIINEAYTIANIVRTYRTCGPARVLPFRLLPKCGVMAAYAVIRTVGHCKGRIAVRSYGIRCISG